MARKIGPRKQWGACGKLSDRIARNSKSSTSGAKPAPIPPHERFSIKKNLGKVFNGKGDPSQKAQFGVNNESDDDGNNQNDVIERNGVYRISQAEFDNFTMGQPSRDATRSVDNHSYNASPPTVVVIEEEDDDDDDDSRDSLPALEMSPARSIIYSDDRMEIMAHGERERPSRRRESRRSYSQTSIDSPGQTHVQRSRDNRPMPNLNYSHPIPHPSQSKGSCGRHGERRSGSSGHPFATGSAGFEICHDDSDESGCEGVPSDSGAPGHRPSSRDGTSPPEECTGEYTSSDSSEEVDDAPSEAASCSSKARDRTKRGDLSHRHWQDDDDLHCGLNRDSPSAVDVRPSSSCTETTYDKFSHRKRTTFERYRVKHPDEPYPYRQTRSRRRSRENMSPTEGDSPTDFFSPPRRLRRSSGQLPGLPAGYEQGERSESPSPSPPRFIYPHLRTSSPHHHHHHHHHHHQTRTSPLAHSTPSETGETSSHSPPQQHRHQRAYTSPLQQKHLEGAGEGSVTSVRADGRKSARDVLLRRAMENSFIQATSSQFVDRPGHTASPEQADIPASRRTSQECQHSVTGTSPVATGSDVGRACNVRHTRDVRLTMSDHSNTTTSSQAQTSALKLSVSDIKWLEKKDSARSLQSSEASSTSDLATPAEMPTLHSQSTSALPSWPYSGDHHPFPNPSPTGRKSRSKGSPGCDLLLPGLPPPGLWRGEGLQSAQESSSSGFTFADKLLCDTTPEELQLPPIAYSPKSYSGSGSCDSRGSGVSPCRSRSTKQQSLTPHSPKPRDRKSDEPTIAYSPTSFSGSGSCDSGVSPCRSRSTKQQSLTPRSPKPQVRNSDDDKANAHDEAPQSRTSDKPVAHGQAGRSEESDKSSTSCEVATWLADSAHAAETHKAANTDSGLAKAKDMISCDHTNTDSEMPANQQHGRVSSLSQEASSTSVECNEGSGRPSPAKSEGTLSLGDTSASCSKSALKCHSNVTLPPESERTQSPPRTSKSSGTGSLHSRTSKSCLKTAMKQRSTGLLSTRRVSFSDVKVITDAEVTDRTCVSDPKSSGEVDFMKGDLIVDSTVPSKRGDREFASSCSGQMASTSTDSLLSENVSWETKSNSDKKSATGDTPGYSDRDDGEGSSAQGKEKDRKRATEPRVIVSVERERIRIANQAGVFSFETDTLEMQSGVLSSERGKPEEQRRRLSPAITRDPFSPSPTRGHQTPESLTSTSQLSQKTGSLDSRPFFTTAGSDNRSRLSSESLNWSPNTNDGGDVVFKESFSSSSDSRRSHRSDAKKGRQSSQDKRTKHRSETRSSSGHKSAEKSPSVKSEKSSSQSSEEKSKSAKKSLSRQSAEKSCSTKSLRKSRGGSSGHELYTVDQPLLVDLSVPEEVSSGSDCRIKLPPISMQSGRYKLLSPITPSPAAQSKPQSSQLGSHRQHQQQSSASGESLRSTSSNQPSAGSVCFSASGSISDRTPSDIQHPTSVIPVVASTPSSRRNSDRTASDRTASDSNRVSSDFGHDNPNPVASATSEGSSEMPEFASENLTRSMSFDSFQEMLAKRTPGAFFKPIIKEESTGSTDS